MKMLANHACAALNPAIASRLQSNALVDRVVIRLKWTKFFTT